MELPWLLDILASVGVQPIGVLVGMSIGAGLVLWRGVPQVLALRASVSHRDNLIKTLSHDGNQLSKENDELRAQETAYIRVTNELRAEVAGLRTEVRLLRDERTREHADHVEVRAQLASMQAMLLALQAVGRGGNVNQTTNVNSPSVDPVDGMGR